MRKLHNLTGQAFDMANFIWSSGSDGSIGRAYLRSDKYFTDGKINCHAIRKLRNVTGQVLYFRML